MDDLRAMLLLWQTQPTQEKIACIAVAIFFPLIILGFAVVTP